MIKAILSFLSGGVAKEIRRAFEAKQDAQTEQERIDAEVYLAQVEAQTERAIAGGRIITAIQVTWAAVYLIYDAKLVLWDKVLGWGVTDGLSPELASRQALIMAFLFGPNAIRKVIGK